MFEVTTQEVVAEIFPKKAMRLPPPPHTGWPPGLLQDDSRELSKWLSNRPGARRQVDLVCFDIIRRTAKDWELTC